MIVWTNLILLLFSATIYCQDHFFGWEPPKKPQVISYSIDHWSPPDHWGPPKDSWGPPPPPPPKDPWAMEKKGWEPEPPKKGWEPEPPPKKGWGEPEKKEPKKKIFSKLFTLEPKELDFASKFLPDKKGWDDGKDDDDDEDDKDPPKGWEPPKKGWEPEPKKEPKKDKGDFFKNFDIGFKS